MPEFRRDPLTGTWSVIASERHHRTHDVAGAGQAAPRPLDCPFCPGNEEPGVLEVPLAGGAAGQGWSTRVVANKYPALAAAPAAPPADGPLRQAVPAIGFHEVVVTSRVHEDRTATMSVDQLDTAFDACQRRMRDHAADPRVASFLLLENSGQQAGASRSHPHWQIFGMSIVPDRLARELEHVAAHRAATGRCLSCDILAEEEAAGVRVVAAEPGFVTLTPFASKYPYEMLIVPRTHRASFVELPAGERRALAAHLKGVLSRLDRAVGSPPFNWFLHTAPRGLADRDFHWHISIVPRAVHIAGWELATEGAINSLGPELAAAALRDA